MDTKSSGDWRPTADLEVLKTRARLLAQARAFFSGRGVLEVETPVLSGAATTDPALASFTTRYTGPLHPQGQSLYLQTSPEFPMKRLLAAGSGSIYQIGKVFRDGEAGRRHNPEFTLLEWYRVGFDHHRLMQETGELVMDLLAPLSWPPPERLTYREAFQRHAGLDPFAASPDEFRRAAASHGIQVSPGMSGQSDIDAWRDLLLTHAVEPNLGQGRLTFIYDYPATQAAFARIQPGQPPLAARFELYCHGMELANGFHELADADEQRARFDQHQRVRAAAGLPVLSMDERLLAALAHGLPDCAGVALGFDRLVMLACGARAISDVLAFPLERA